MLAALGSLASWAVPQLLTFASKKLFNTNIGQSVAKTMNNPKLRGIGRNIKRNYVKMMNNDYDYEKDGQQNATSQYDKKMQFEKYITPQQVEEDYQDQQQEQEYKPKKSIRKNRPVTKPRRRR